MKLNNNILRFCLVFTTCTSLFCLIIIIDMYEQDKFQELRNLNNMTTELNRTRLTTVEDKYSELIFGDNRTGFAELIVPNIVHNILFGINEIKFSHFISILSVLKNQMPDILYIHCNCQQLIGDYYQRVMNIANKTNTKIIIRYIEQPTQIFGKNITKNYLKWHSSDITRLWVLSQLGGIYLDNDVYVVQSLDVFRKYEMTIGWDEGLYLGNQVIIAHKNARFLHRYIKSYSAYEESKWYYNAGELPTLSILNKDPDIVHRVRDRFGVVLEKICPKIYLSYYAKWRQEFYTVHFIMRGNYVSWPLQCFDKGKPEVLEFNEYSVAGMSATFGDMCRDVLFWNV